MLRAYSLVVALVLSGCIGSAPGKDPETPEPPAALAPSSPAQQLSKGATVPRFEPPVVVDAVRPGGEPVLFVTPEGSLLIAAHPGPTHSSPLVGQPDAGLLLSFTAENMMWRSTDAGDTWQYIGFAGLDQGPRDVAFSISDPDLTADSAGNIYHVSLYNPGDAAVGLGMSISNDDGVTWTGSPLEPGGDRPWISARGEHDVFVAVHGHIYRSIAGSDGIRLASQGHSPFSAPDNNLQVHPDGSLYHGGRSGLARSVDDGATWQEIAANRSRSSGSGWMMGEPVFDDNGTVYTTYMVQGQPTYSVWRGDTHIAEWQVANLTGTHVWPWIVAGAGGRIAIVWLGTLEAANTGSDAGWRLFAAVVRGADTDAPQWSVVAATPVIHEGVLCQSGVGCAAASDRRLGDFLTAAIDPQGRLIIASAATFLEGEEIGNDGWWGRPIFVRQASGPFLRDLP